MLRDSVTEKLDMLFAKVGIVQIHSPLSRAVVRIHIDLTLGDGTEKRCCEILPSIHQCTFSKINLIARTDDTTSDAKRRLADSHRNWSSIGRAVVTETELQISARILRHVSEAESGCIVIWNPASIR